MSAVLFSPRNISSLHFIEMGIHFAHVSSTRSGSCPARDVFIQHSFTPTRFLCPALKHDQVDEGSRTWNADL